MWFRIFVIAAAVVALSYWIGFSVLSQVLEDHGFYPGRDGKFHNKNEDPKPIFTYCLKDAVCEAFRVGDENVPSWATTSPELDVVVSQPPRVILHKEDGTMVNAPEGSYIMLFDGKQIGIVPAKALNENFVKVQLQEEDA